MTARIDALTDAPGLLDLIESGEEPPFTYAEVISSPSRWRDLFDIYWTNAGRREPRRTALTFLNLDQINTDRSSEPNFRIHRWCSQLVLSPDHLDVGSGNTLDLPDSIYERIRSWYLDPGDEDSECFGEVFWPLWKELSDTYDVLFDGFREDFLALRSAHRMSKDGSVVMSKGSTAHKKMFTSGASPDDFVESRPVNVTWVASKGSGNDRLGSVQVQWAWENKAGDDRRYASFRVRSEHAAIPSNVLSSDGHVDARTVHSENRRNDPTDQSESVEIMRRWWGSREEDLTVVSESESVGGDSWVDTLVLEWTDGGMEAWAPVSTVNVKRTLLKQNDKVLARVELSGEGGSPATFDHEVPGSKWSTHAVSDIFRSKAKPQPPTYLKVEDWDRDNVQAKNKDNQKNQARTKGQSGEMPVHVAAPYFLIGDHDRIYIDSLKSKEDGTPGADAKARYDADYELGWASIKRGRLFDAGTVSISGVNNKHNQGCIEQAILEYSDKKVVFED